LTSDGSTSSTWALICLTNSAPLGLTEKSP
jgi:hypothetical protein